jgi:hypothetical protein
MAPTFTVSAPPSSPPVVTPLFSCQLCAKRSSIPSRRRQSRSHICHVCLFLFSLHLSSLCLDLQGRIKFGPSTTCQTVAPATLLVQARWRCTFTSAASMLCSECCGG